MSELSKKPDAAAKKEFARESALPARVELKNAWCQMVTLCLETADTWGAIDHVFTHEMFNRGEMGLIEGHDRALGAALGGELPDALRPDHTYYGAPRLIVPTQRSVTFKGEALTLKIIALDKEAARNVTVQIRPLGSGEWKAIPATQLARAVWNATLPAATDDFEYRIVAESATGANLTWPATAPEMNQTVVVVP